MTVPANYGTEYSWACEVTEILTQRSTEEAAFVLG